MKALKHLWKVVVVVLVLAGCEEAAPPTEPYDLPPPPATEPKPTPEPTPAPAPTPTPPSAPPAPPPADPVPPPNAPSTQGPMKFPAASVAYSGKVGDSFSQQLPAATGGKDPIEYSLISIGVIEGLRFDESTRTLAGTPTSSGSERMLLFAIDSGDGVYQRAAQMWVRVSIEALPAPTPAPAAEVKEQCVSVSLALKNHAEATRPSGRYGDTDGLFNIRWTPATLPAWVPAAGRPSGRVSQDIRNLRLSPSRVEAESCTLRGTFSYGQTTVWLQGRCASSGIYSTASTGAAWKQYMRSHTFSGKWMCTPQGCRQPNPYRRECR